MRDSASGGLPECAPLRDPAVTAAIDASTHNLRVILLKHTSQAPRQAQAGARVGQIGRRDTPDSRARNMRGIRSRDTWWLMACSRPPGHRAVEELVQDRA